MISEMNAIIVTKKIKESNQFFWTKKAAVLMIFQKLADFKNCLPHSTSALKNWIWIAYFSLMVKKNMYASFINLTDTVRQKNKLLADIWYIAYWGLSSGRETYVVFIYDYLINI